MKTIAVDFDGTLVDNRYPEIGPLLPGAKEAWRRMERFPARIVVFTARDKLDEVRRFLQSNGLHASDVTNTKPREASVFIDDRAIPFRGDWDEAVNAAAMRLRAGDAKE